MKKLALTIVAVLGLSMTTFAEGGGLFQRGTEPEYQIFMREDDPLLPGMPGEHDLFNNTDAPLGTGIAIMTALGAAYLIGKRRKED